jgi:hypothetical protein
MLESYRMTLGIYPFGLYLVNHKAVPISGTRDHWSTYFRLLPKAGNEITKFGWATITSNEFRQGFGYVTNSIAFDYIQRAVLENCMVY